MQLFVPITKVDAQKRLVYGTVAAETPDKAGEIFDYASSKPNFERWSAEIAKASDGRSRGNLRAMHGKVAAGKLTDIRFDDGAKRIEAVAKVVDDDEWQKVEEGVYTGFSIGGKYARRWRDDADPALTRYTAAPSEVSLVDNPCIPTATFEMVKSDGSRERRKFRHPSAASAAKVGDGDCGCLGKVGARHSKADLARVQRLHDTAVELGAICAGASDGDGDGNAMPDGDADDEAKLALGGALAKLMAERDGLAKQLAALAPELAALRKRLDVLEAQPLPPKGALRAVDKKSEAFGAAAQEDDPPADPLTLIKQAHRNPQRAFVGGLAKS